MSYDICGIIWLNLESLINSADKNVSMQGTNLFSPEGVENYSKSLRFKFLGFSYVRAFL